MRVKYPFLAAAALELGSVVACFKGLSELGQYSREVEGFRTPLSRQVERIDSELGELGQQAYRLKDLARERAPLKEYDALVERRGKLMADPKVAAAVDEFARKKEAALQRSHFSEELLAAFVGTIAGYCVLRAACRGRRAEAGR